MPYNIKTARESMGVIFGLIGLCVVAYFMQQANPGPTPEYLDGVSQMFALNRASITEDYEVWRLITYAFLHDPSGWFHIIANMWGLYLFGSMVAHVMTPTRVVLLYLISAVIGGLIQISVAPDWCIGASGAVCGFTAAAAMVMPNAKIMIIFAPIPMSMRTFFWIFIGLELLLNVSAQDNVAHMAHLGGMFGGYAYLRYLGVGIWDPFLALIGRGQIRQRRRNADTHYPDDPRYTYDDNPPPRSSGSSSDPNDEPINSREVDRLLDKISKSGINSLTPEEFDLLKRAKDRLQRR